MATFSDIAYPQQFLTLYDVFNHLPPLPFHSTTLFPSHLPGPKSSTHPEMAALKSSHQSIARLAMNRLLSLLLLVQDLRILII